MKKITYLYCLFAPLFLVAQSVVQLEYFIDQDPGYGNATVVNIGGGSDVTIDFTADLSQVSTGVHNLYVRAKDSNGHWSLTQNRVFIKQNGVTSNPNVAALEYFIDEDPGYGNGSSISSNTTGTDVTFDFAADLTNVPAGVHNLYVRAKDENGNWSLTQNRVFIKQNGVTSNPNVAALEYFIDEDPGYGNGVSIAANPTNTDVTFNFTADLTNISGGVHNLYVRAKDENGHWSLTQNRVFIKQNGVTSNPNVAALEYFIDEDPGYGNGVSIAANPTNTDVTFNFTADLTSISGGVHNLYVRAKDENGNWSLVQNRVFIKQSSLLSSNSNITQIEYFVDTDPGVGAAQSVTNFTPAPDVTADFVADVTGLAAGTHQLYVRAKDAAGNWSPPRTAIFELTDDNAPSICFTLAGFQICATDIEATNNLRIFRGNVRIRRDFPTAEDILFFDNDITVNSITNTISGNATIRIPNIGADNDTIELQTGHFSFSIPEDSDTTLIQSDVDQVIKLLKLSGFKVSIDKISLIKDGVHINGKLGTPNILKYRRSEEDSTSTADLKAEITDLYLTRSNGLDVRGDIYLAKAMLGNTYGVKEMHLNFDSFKDEISGEATISLPHFSLMADMAWKKGEMDRVLMDLEFMPLLPIATTGWGLEHIRGGFDNLAYTANNPDITDTTKSQVPPIIRANADFALIIPGLGDTGLVRITKAGLEYAYDTYFRLQGELELLGQHVARSEANFYGLDHLEVSTTIDVLSVIKGHAKLSFIGNHLEDTDYSFCGTGKFGSALCTPSLATINKVESRWVRQLLKWVGPGIRLADGYNYFNLQLSPTQKQAYWAGTAYHRNFPRIYYFLYYNFSLEALAVNIGTDQALIPFKDATDYLASNQKFRKRASDQKMFIVGEATPSVVVDAENSQTQPNFTITLPDGSEVRPDNYEQVAQVEYWTNPATNYAAYYITNPQAGVYLVNMQEVDSLAVYGGNTPPCIDLVDMDNHNNGTTTLRWEDSDPDDDAQISLFYDTDQSGANGTPIVLELSENEETDEYTFNYSDFPTGTYYIFAQIVDAQQQTSSCYYSVPLTVVENNAPNAPSNLSVTQNAAGIQLSWQKNNPDFIRYAVYYSNEAGTVNYTSPAIVPGDVNTVNITHLPAGNYYEFMVTAIDSLSKESEGSNIVNVNHISTNSNNHPYFNTQNFTNIAYVGQNYSYTPMATDADNDVLSFQLFTAPSGMSVNGTGALSWSPTNQQIGFHQVKLQVSDSNGASDSVFYQINVVTTESATAFLTFSQSTYLTTDDMAMVMITDRDYNGSPNIRDQVNIRLFSNSDLTGVVFPTIEAEPNTNQFNLCFGIHNAASTASHLSVTEGDTIWASYQDQNPNATIQSFAHYKGLNRVKAKVWLAGADNGNVMQTMPSNLLPQTQPYTHHLARYIGAEQVAVMPNNIVDWVLFEARNPYEVTDVVETRAALLRNDGTLIGIDGLVGIPFSYLVPNLEYHFVIRHRNHLDVMSAESLTINNNTPHDFTNPNTVLGGSQQLTHLGNNKYGLSAGDINGDGIISVADFNDLVGELSNSNAYLQADCNLDGQVLVQDFNLYQANSAKIGVSAVRY